ncbi:DUF3306 domain-containing protein [Vibrio mediterranei]|uniref:DUF3306 domain-containing protein n=1 Tax=Vibrio mediterranei TaxID=689 RepID=A0AAN1FHZ4_9VIBR|nr:DUF3306 domain-containing protein [Vibrio mediterranei]ASI90918.1 hypothetical protein BSZ05_14595 [Vibrio mediterranei]
MASSFLSRWSQRKLDENKDELELDALPESNEVDAVSEGNAESEVEREQAEHEECSSKGEKSLDSEVPEKPEELSVSQLLANPEVDKAVKKAALRKMFMSPEYNVVDGLNDYDHDYSAVKPLASDVAETLRGWIKNVADETESEEPVASVQPEQDDKDIEALHTETEGQDDIEKSEADADYFDNQGFDDHEPNDKTS